jgi:hypothetical protein
MSDYSLPESYGEEAYLESADDGYEGEYCPACETRHLEPPCGHHPGCECRECLGADHDRYHNALARDEYSERS